MATATLSPTHTTTTTITTNPLATITTPFDTAMDAASPDFLKLEDLDNSSTADFSAATPQHSHSHYTPPPVIVQSKPAKKRKSWGQQLPEPKTTLPPRKRAKTEDEKEQRRIERIKRNRAAAHNSRERKRQEAEVLAVENAQLRTKLDAFERHFGPLPKHIVLPEVTLCTDDADTPAPSLVESRGSIATAPSPASPPDLYDMNVDIKQEPHDSPLSELHHSFDALDGKQPMPTLAPLDETQHSAEMLCHDLPCPSSARARAAHPPPHPSRLLSSLSLTTSITLTLMMNLSFLHTYRTLLVALWTARARTTTTTPTTSPSSSAPTTRAASRPASTSPSTTSSAPTASSPRAPRSRSATALAQRNAATAVPATIAALRGPLVGEGTARTTVRLATAVADEAGSGRGMMASRGQSGWNEAEGKRDLDEGVRRRRNGSMR